MSISEHNIQMIIMVFIATPVIGLFVYYPSVTDDNKSKEPDIIKIRTTYHIMEKADEPTVLTRIKSVTDQYLLENYRTMKPDCTVDFGEFDDFIAKINYKDHQKKLEQKEWLGKIQKIDWEAVVDDTIYQTSVKPKDCQ
jgi:hypothetical protein